MLFEQTHYLPTGTNWNGILIIGGIVLISVCVIVYVAHRKPASVSKCTYKPKSKDDTVIK